MKKVAVLGSTGSIGTQTLDVVRANDDLEVVGLAAGSNVEMLEKQIREFHPRLVAVWKEEAARDLAVRVQDLDVKIVSQMGGLIELARMEESDILVTAIVGMIGIRPTMEAILAGKDIALANKETLVTAGHYSGCGSAAEYYPLYGGIRGRCSDGTAWNTGYETSDTVCIMLPGQKIFKRRQTGFSYVEADHL